MDCVALGNRVKNKRLSLNMTQEQLAELVDIADVLKTSIEELLKDTTINNINARLFELTDVVKDLESEDIDKIINITKILYK